ncbi:MAG: class A beta-lactamase-related serine hydrolase, partial [Bacteroidetes bacterium]|nr:class A beta-lactamase-related serine hydrolase [Bacteroidota bacterium]
AIYNIFMKARNKPEPTLDQKFKHILIRVIIPFNIVLIGVIIWQFNSLVNARKEITSISSKDNSGPENLRLIRCNDYSLTKPLRVVDIEKESPLLWNLKETVASIIDSKKKSGEIINASVYFKKMNDGSWCSVNDQEKYRPGSINKIPILIYYLKLAEKEPGLLNVSWPYNQPIDNPKNETYRKGSLVLGQSYKVKDLLREMIVNSDNIATTLLLVHLKDYSKFEEIFRELGLTPPEPHSFDYAISASECSRFLRVLYNSSYLSEEHSQFALEMLTNCSFIDGMVKNLPKNIKVAHKFGEAGNTEQPEFSETGIVYKGSNTYLLTIMTHGNNAKEQAETISEISKAVFDEVKE